MGKEPDDLRQVADAFRRGGGGGKSMALQAAVSFAADENEALAAAHRNWPVATVDLTKNQDLANPWDFDRATTDTRPEDLTGKLRISADLGRHAEWIRRDAEPGFGEVYLHHVGPDPRAFLDAFGDNVLPELAR